MTPLKESRHPQIGESNHTTCYRKTRKSVRSIQTYVNLLTHAHAHLEKMKDGRQVCAAQETQPFLVFSLLFNCKYNRVAG
jgi:hypothetical protein